MENGLFEEFSKTMIYIREQHLGLNNRIEKTDESIRFYNHQDKQSIEYRINHEWTNLFEGKSPYTVCFIDEPTQNVTFIVTKENNRLLILIFLFEEPNSISYKERTLHSHGWNTTLTVEDKMILSKIRKPFIDYLKNTNKYRLLDATGVLKLEHLA